MKAEIGEELRRFVSERAQSLCEYCLLHEDDAFTPHQVDHIISRKHGGESTVDNLALACVRCNARKGSDIASFGFRREDLVPLFDPRRQRWGDHFLLHGALIEPGIGAATARLLKFNLALRVNERRLLIQCGRFQGFDPARVGRERPRSWRDTPGWSVEQARQPAATDRRPHRKCAA